MVWQCVKFEGACSHSGNEDGRCEFWEDTPEHIEKSKSPGCPYPLAEIPIREGYQYSDGTWAWRPKHPKKGEGPIIKGGGVSKPDHWDNDQWAEYKTTAEYASEVRHVADEDVPDYDDERW